MSMQRCLSVICMIIILTCCLLLLYETVSIRYLLKTYDRDEPIEIRKRSLQQITCLKICTSKTCVTTAASVMESTDVHLLPCNNFYDYVCGRYPAESFHGFDTTRPTHSFVDWEYKTLQKLRRLIETASPEQGRWKAKLIYDSCQSSNNPLTELKILHNVLTESIIPGWPLIKDGHTNITRWIADLMSTQSLPIFMLFIIHFDMEVMIEMGMLPHMIPPDMVNGTQIRWILNTYSNPLTDFFIDVTDSRSVKLLRELLEFLDITPVKINNILADAAEIHNALVAIQLIYHGENQINCSTSEGENNLYCKILKQIITKSKLEVNLNNVVIFSQQPSSIIEHYFTSVPKLKLANFLATQFFLSNLQLLIYTNKYTEHPWDFNLLESPVTLDSRLRCSHLISRYIPSALAVDYVNSTKDSRVIEIIDNTLNTLKKSLEIRLGNSSEIASEEEKQQLIYSILSMRTSFDTYLKFLKAYDAEVVYNSLNTSTDFATNILELKRLDLSEQLVSKVKSFAYALGSKNYINMMISSGNPMQYGLGWIDVNYLDTVVPKYMINSRHGETILHELGHDMPFSNTRECITQAYENLTIPSTQIPVQNHNVFNENLPDFIASILGISFYKDYIETEGEEDSLPGLPYTNEQLFFVLTAKDFCEFGDSVQYTMYNTDSHSPAKYRINIPMRNNIEFANVFKCDGHSYMNPSTKCTLPL